MTEEPIFTKEPTKQEKIFKGNIIEEYTKRVMGTCDAPEIFIRASAYYLISATLGEFYENKLVPKGSSRPNLFIVLSSIPGRTRRSTVQMIAYGIFEDVVGEENAKQMVIDEGTVEGILDQITEEPFTSYTFQSTEYGGTFENITRKGHWQTGVGKLLSKLYYGEPTKQSLSQRGGKSKGRFLPRGLYVTMLVGLQEAHKYFRIRDIDQGLVRRLLIFYIDRKEIKRWLKPIDMTRQGFKMNDITSVLRRKRQQLLKEAVQKRISVILHPEAEDIINEFSRKLDASVVKEGDYSSLYKQSLWEHLLKLATVHCIGRKEPGKGTKEELILTVEKSDIEAATKLIQQIEENIDVVIDKIGEEEEPIRIRKHKQDRVFRKIAMYGRKGISYNLLYKKHFQTWKRESMYEVVDDLKGAGRVIEKIITPQHAGRPSRILVAKEFAQNLR